MEEFVKLEAKAVRKLKNVSNLPLTIKRNKNQIKMSCIFINNFIQNVTQLSESYEINLAKFLSLKSSVDDEIFQKK